MKSNQTSKWSSECKLNHTHKSVLYLRFIILGLVSSARFAYMIPISIPITILGLVSSGMGLPLSKPEKKKVAYCWVEAYRKMVLHMSLYCHARPTRKLWEYIYTCNVCENMHVFAKLVLHMSFRSSICASIGDALPSGRDALTSSIRDALVSSRDELTFSIRDALTSHSLLAFVTRSQCSHPASVMHSHLAFVTHSRLAFVTHSHRTHF